VSLSAAQLAFLADKGMSLADVIEFARLGEVRRDPTAAVRKQRQRDRERAQEDDRDMSHRDVTRDTPIPPLDKEKSPEPPKEINPPLTPSVGAAKRGTRLPDDFEIPEDWLRWAMAERHWAMADARAEAATFIDHWHAKAGRDAAKLDWGGTWRNWVRNSRRTGVVAGGRDAIRV
jgi:hypothetical protein